MYRILIKSASERRNHFEPETDGYYNRKANTSSANTIGNDTGRTGWGIECYPAGAIELGPVNRLHVFSFNVFKSRSHALSVIKAIFCI